MEDTNPYLKDCKKTTNIEIPCHSSDGPRKKNNEYDMMALENHLYRPTRSERIRHSEHWTLRLNQDALKNPLNQRPDFVQAKRECKRLMWQRCNQNVEPSLATNKYDSDEDKRSKDTKNTTTMLMLELVGGFIKSHMVTCHLRPRQQISIEAIGRREPGTLGILYGLTICLGPVSVGWEIKFPTTDGRVNRHTSHMTCLSGCPHRSRTHAFTHHANTRGSSTTRCPKTSSSSTSHVSSFAAHDTDVLHRLTVTYLPIILSHTIRSTELRSVFPLR